MPAGQEDPTMDMDASGAAVFSEDPTPDHGLPARQPEPPDSRQPLQGPRPPRSSTVIQYTPPPPGGGPSADPNGEGAAAAPPAAGLDGTATFGRYTLTGLLAEGGMARVYHAVLRDESGFEKPLAIKCMHARLGEDPEFVSRFVDEARIASTLNHSNIVQVFDFGKGAGERYYLAMELVQGPDLGALLDRLQAAGRPLPIPAALYIAAGTLRGLGAAHRRLDRDGAPAPVVHRDMSPQNILISLSGEVKVADFGIAKAAGKLVQTEAGTVMGKFFYMSPEQCQGQSVDARADIFSTGCVMFEMLTGRSLWRGGSPVEIMRQVIQAPIPPLQSVNPAVPEELGAILSRALNRDPQRRYADGNEMARELERLLHRLAPGYSRDDLADLVREMESPPPTADGDAGALWSRAGDGSPSLDELRHQGASGETGPRPPTSALPDEAEGVVVSRPETEIHPLSDSQLGPASPAAQEPEVTPAPLRPTHEDRPGGSGRRAALVLALAIVVGASLGAAAALLVGGQRQLALVPGQPVQAGPWRLTLKAARPVRSARGPRLLLELWTNRQDPAAGRHFSRRGAPPLLWSTATVQGEALLRLVFEDKGDGVVWFAPPDAEPVALVVR